MLNRPVFFLMVKIAVPMDNGKTLRLFFPLPLFWINDLVENIADLLALVNLITFGRMRVSLGEYEKRGKMKLKTVASVIYLLSDVLTELSLFTGPTDFVDVDIADKDEKAKVKIYTF